MVLTLRAGIKQIPPDPKGGHSLERDEIETTAEDYFAARDLIYAEVGQNRPGWRVIWLMPVPTTEAVSGS